MSETIDQLRTILRLRKRDLDRCETAVMEARGALTLAETEERRAARAHERALYACTQARVDQTRQPCDPLVQLHCQATQDRADAAQQARIAASAAMGEARAFAERMKQEWLRAQGRHDAIMQELDGALRLSKRQAARRAEDEVRPAPMVLA